LRTVQRYYQLIRSRFQVKPATLLIQFDLFLINFGGGDLRYPISKWHDMNMSEIVLWGSQHQLEDAAAAAATLELLRWDPGRACCAWEAATAAASPFRCVCSFTSCNKSCAHHC